MNSDVQRMLQTPDGIPGSSGSIILLNGASSAGKSSIALALQAILSDPFWHISIDHLRDSGVLPLKRIRAGDFSWPSLRDSFFRGFERSLAAYAEEGNNLIVEYIIEDHVSMNRIAEVLRPFDVYLVGVHCELSELERREEARGDRALGDARRDHGVVHRHVEYDLEVDGTLSPSANAATIKSAWSARSGRTF